MRNLLKTAVPSSRAVSYDKQSEDGSSSWTRIGGREPTRALSEGPQEGDEIVEADVLLIGQVPSSGLREKCHFFLASSPQQVRESSWSKQPIIGQSTFKDRSEDLRLGEGYATMDALFLVHFFAVCHAGACEGT
jgi:hypothetical protein